MCGCVVMFTPYQMGCLAYLSLPLHSYKFDCAHLCNGLALVNETRFFQSKEKIFGRQDKNDIVLAVLRFRSE